MFVPSFTFRPWYIMIYYHLYANLVLCFSYTQIKSGTAILLFRFSRLWYCPLIRTSNTETHYVCIYVYAHTARTLI